MIWLRNLAFLFACAAAFTAHGQIAFRAAASATAAQGTVITHVGAGASASRNNCGDINPSIPAGLADDVLIALVNARESSATVTMAGWNQAYADTYPGQEFKVFVFWRLATGADPNTVNQSGTCSSIAAQIARFRGVDPAQPLETSPIPASNAVRQDANNVDTGSQVTTFNASMLLVAAFIEDNRTVSEGAGWSESFDSNLNLTRDLGLSLHYRLATAAGATLVTNWSTGPPRRNYGILFALRPAPASLTVNVPAGTAADDVMVASIAVRPCSNTSSAACTLNATAPAGWTLVRTVDQTTGAGTGGFGNRLFVYQRVAAAEPASYTWTISGPPGHAGAAGAIASFQGVDTVSPIVAEAGQATGNAFSHSAPSIDTGTTTNTVLVASFSNNSSATWTLPGGMTEAADAASLAVPDALGLSLAVGYEPRPAGGATGARTAAHSNPPASDTGATHMLALRPGLHHYAISPTAATVATCDYVDITIVAHSASHAAVNAPGGRAVALSTSTGTGVWQAGLVAGTGAWAPSGLNNGAATYIWPGGESGFTVRLRHTSVATLSVNLNDGTAVEDPTEDSTLTFADSALRISNGANAPLSIGSQIAGKPSSTAPGAQSLFLQAIRTDTVTGACVSLFPSGAEASVDVGAQCNTPAACSQNVALTSSAGASNSASFVPNGAYAASMSFRFSTANAEAPFTLNYGDAGRITLQFRTLLPAPPAATYIAGSSNGFVVRPFGFAFTGAAHGTTATDPVLAAAGDNFAMTIGAYRWSAADDSDNDGVADASADLRDNGLTPNFAAATSVDRTANLAGVSLGTISRASGAAVVAPAEWSGGTAVIGDWRYSEVGNVFLTAGAADYLGDVNADVSGNSGNDGTGAAGGYIGRFKPHHFFVSASTLTNRVAAACASSFTYMNEGIGLAFTLQARSAAGGVTQNYTAAYAKLDPASIGQLGLGAVGLNPAATDLTGRIDSSLGSSGVFTNGVAAVAATVPITRASPSTVDGPFTDLRIGIAAQEPAGADGVGMRPADFNLDVDAAGGNDHVQIGASTLLRFGRLRVDNAVGSQSLDLPIAMRAEHWAGTAFVTNADDNCTRIAAGNIAFGNYRGGINAANMNAANLSGLGGPFSAGVGNFALLKPTGAVAAPGSVDLCVDLGNDATPPPACVAGAPAARSYLQGRSSGANYDDDPQARAAFGLYGSQPNNFIYFRENF